MQTLLDASDTEAEWLVKLTAGLPGGIGNTGAECGGVSAPLILIGLRHARDAVRDGLPPVIDKGHDLLQRFAGCHGTTLCREIRGTDRLPLRCVGAVRHAPELCAQTLSSACAGVIPAASRDAYRRLYAHFVEKQFHCAHPVLQQVRHTNPASQDMLQVHASTVKTPWSATIGRNPSPSTSNAKTRRTSSRRWRRAGEVFVG
jgi:hypothetical protein